MSSSRRKDRDEILSILDFICSIFLHLCFQIRKFSSKSGGSLPSLPSHDVPAAALQIDRCPNSPDCRNWKNMTRSDLHNEICDQLEPD